MMTLAEAFEVVQAQKNKKSRSMQSMALKRLAAEVEKLESIAKSNEYRQLLEQLPSRLEQAGLIDSNSEILRFIETETHLVGW